MKNKKLTIKSLIALVVFLLIIGLSFDYYNWKNNYQNRIYPGVKVGAIDLSGKNYEEAQILLSQASDKTTNLGIDFQYENKKTKLDLISSPSNPDLSYQAVDFNIDEMLKQAFSYGKDKLFIDFLFFQISGSDNKNINAIYSLDEQKIISLLNDAYKELNIPPENASFYVSENTQKLELGHEKIGKEINYELVFTDIRANLNNFDSKTINIKTHSKYPEVKAEDLGTIENEVKKVINESGLTIIYLDKKTGTTSEKWLIKPSKLITWLSVIKDQGKLLISLDKQKIKDYLTLTVSPKVNIEAVRPRFEIKNGKVSSWQRGSDGQELDLEETANKISNEFLSGNKEIILIIKEVTSEVINPDDTYKIKEIIGTGHSNFVGSPVNRRKNIQVGAKAVNGMLLAPGEEFSLVKALGDVSEQSGYFPELVIKDNKTIPEFGGGLCQVATTIFRSALASGLPITARRNHSYRVSYYEPAGTDAAVYIPNPDVKFVNDTANYILIQSRIVNNDIYFDFWGTKDGRVASTTYPTIYNIVKPAPTKYVETTELAVGQKKCTEKAHNGADAYFDYKVTYPAGASSTSPLEKRFSSHYVPWQEVCLIGVAKNISTSSSSTKEVIKPSASSSSTTIPKI
ncbi:MAG: VanW family protein [Patescibacteria group bacterium]